MRRRFLKVKNCQLKGISWLFWVCYVYSELKRIFVALFYTSCYLSTPLSQDLTIYHTILIFDTFY